MGHQQQKIMNFLSISNENIVGFNRMFGGYLRSQVCCTKCDYKSNTYDPFLDLSLEVSSKKVNCIYSALKEYTRKETLDVANKWKCSGCKQRVCATKQLTCFRPPLSLCIQLKRFSFGGGGMGGYMHHQFGYSHFAGKGMGMRTGGSKIQKTIEFPAELKLPLSDGRCCEYVLTGVVIHVGHSATSGHYTAFVRRQMKNGSQWYHMDDSFVEPVKEKTVLRQRDAYVLFYCRKEVKLSLPNPPQVFSTAEAAKLANATKARKRADSQNKDESSTTENDDSQSVAVKITLDNGLSLKKAHKEDSTSSISQLDSKVHELPSDQILRHTNKKSLTLNQGTKGGSIQVLLGKLKRKKKAWKPSIGQGDSESRGLLGNAEVSKWDDSDNMDDSLLRKTILRESKQEQKSRKRKMYLDTWDAALDRGRTKKVKQKTPRESNEQLKPSQNQFHRIQQSLMQMNRNGKGKGHTTSLKKRKMRS